MDALKALRMTRVRRQLRALRRPSRDCPCRIPVRNTTSGTALVVLYRVTKEKQKKNRKIGIRRPLYL